MMKRYLKTTVLVILGCMLFTSIIVPVSAVNVPDSSPDDAAHNVSDSEDDERDGMNNIISETTNMIEGNVVTSEEGIYYVDESAVEDYFNATENSTLVLDLEQSVSYTVILPLSVIAGFKDRTFEDW